MANLSEGPVPRMPATEAREWLETNLDVFWREGPTAFVGHLVVADDILTYTERDEDWAEAHLLLEVPTNV